MTNSLSNLCRISELINQQLQRIEGDTYGNLIRRNQLTIAARVVEDSLEGRATIAETIECIANIYSSFDYIERLELREIMRILGYITQSELVSSIISTLPLQTTEALTATKHNIFISYRRKFGADLAMLIYRALMRIEGLLPFIDVESLHAEIFDERLLEVIEHSAICIVVLTPGCLRECRRPGDWLRREIAHALSHSKTIIPVKTQKFVYPPTAQVPPDIADLLRWQSVTYVHELSKESIEKIIRLTRRCIMSEV